MTPSTALVPIFESRREAVLDRLRAWVEHETPSDDLAALRSFAAVLARTLHEAGGDVATIEVGGRPHLRAHFGASNGRPHALVLGHFDTVWPIGTIQRRPFRIEGGRAYGPGIFDMKAGLSLIVSALETLATLGQPLGRPVTVLFTADEEIGSPTSRELIEAEARGAAFALVAEPCLPGGGLKMARKGVGRFRIDVQGREAHAGIEPEKGASAVVELAHQILAISALKDPAAGSTVTVGVVAGGSVVNVIPGSARAEIDVRVTTAAEARRIEAGLRSLTPRTPGTSLVIEGGLNRPPMEFTPASRALFERAALLAGPLGLTLQAGATGGASDGNFTAALGVPTLDGLGMPGDGAHAVHEHIEIDALPIRAALWATLMRDLD